MQRFETLTGVAAPLPIANIDTDKILPGQYLKTISRKGLGEKLFAAIRYEMDGTTEKPDFILNREPWRQARILIALDNFGCGSSREHAPWSLTDFGIYCVIAPGFADIFYNNCFKNGILPIILPAEQVDALLDLAADPERCRLYIDLPAQTITTLADGRTIPFDLAPERKDALLNGLDEIGTSLKQAASIDAWEERGDVIAPAIPMDIDALPLPLSGKAA